MTTGSIRAYPARCTITQYTFLSIGVSLYFRKKTSARIADLKHHL
jgi:hypothetical protein